MNRRIIEPLARTERLLVRLDDSPWGELYRAALGFALEPAASVLFGRGPSWWVLGMCLLALLFALRLGLALARKLLPFSTALRHVWAERRQIAKRYDSWQWRKLFWIGVGLAARILVSPPATLDQLVLTSMCLVSGTAGMLTWRASRAPAESMR